MIRDIHPVQWTGRQAAVKLPEHLDVSNAAQVSDELLAVINRDAEALTADMTATISCDNAGAEALARAYKRSLIRSGPSGLVGICSSWDGFWVWLIPT